MKMTEFLDDSSIYAIRRVLPGKTKKESPFHQFRNFCYNLAELDTIYRLNNQEEEVVNDESTKINEYLTYNW